MGTTLQNGVYLPNEGERNCYAGLKTNWEILDQKVADVTALQQAVAGALHREIVESLPTTDIDPNTIYMVLSGTSATENVYNEFMYVNNAWELIGTSATDLTNYYTKAEVDGKLLLKANASDLTSHTGDTTIHVTTADKNKWNNGVSQSYVLRYSSSSVTDYSTIAYSTLDNTDNIKSGDKIIDSDGKIFSIVSVDTANSTFTVGSALIDLALDANVVHTSGNETVGGNKTFLSSPIIYNPDTSVNDYLVLKNPKATIGSTTDTGSQRVVFQDKNGTVLSSLISSVDSNGWTYTVLEGSSIDSQSNIITQSVRLRVTNTGAALLPSNNNSLLLGSASAKWASVYATNYYYGANNVEFSTKFVTTDTNQTISGNKIFTNTIKSQKEIEFTGNRLAYILPEFSASYSGLSLCTYGSSGAVKIGAWKVDDNDNTKHVLDTSLGHLNVTIGAVNGVNCTYLTPRNSTSSKLGDSTNKWKKINGLTPSSLSLPDIDNKIDISSYITDLAGVNNEYTPVVNGWISIRSSNATKISILDSATNIGNQSVSSTATYLTVLVPCIANKKVYINVVCSSLSHAYFIPCQGNV